MAPYEADAQMAFLAINGRVDVVLTEDSDMLPYGCPKVSTQQLTPFIIGVACCKQPYMTTH